MASTGQVGRFLGATTFGALTFGLVCGQLGVLSLGWLADDPTKNPRNLDPS